MQYYKAYSASAYLGENDWNNIIGGGKRKSIKIAKSAKFYLIEDDTILKLRRVSKSEFKESLFDGSKHRENGKNWYWGMACKIRIKNGKVIKLV